MSRTNIVEKIETHILYSVFIFVEKLAVYETKLKNFVEGAGHR